MSALKVMYAIDSLHGGGAEISLIEMASPLLERGVELEIVTLLEDDHVLSERVHDAGIRTTKLGARTWPGWAAGLREHLALARPDLLHTSLVRGDVCGRVAAVHVDVPVVTSLVNSSYGPEHRRQSRYGAWAVRAVQALDAITARRTDVFHAISRDVAAVMSRRLHLDESRVVVVHRGRDDRRLGRRSISRRVAARRSLGIQDDVPVVLVVGRLDKQKGIDVAVRAFQTLTAHRPDARLIIAGRDGNAADTVRQAVAATPGAALLGHRTDVPELMCAADCLAFPSRWEGLGGTLIEALALELPIVASDIGPIREVLGNIAWPLARVDDHLTLSRGLHAVLSDYAHAQRTALAGRRRFEALFTVDAAAEGMLNVYERAVQGRQP